MTQRCYLGLGSNLQQPEQQLKHSLSALNNTENISVACVSSFYRSSPMGPQDQPDYVNAVAGIDTNLEPLALLDSLQAIESDQGRQREIETRWGARTLDLDILLYAEQIISHDRLQIPHPGLDQRHFVLYPLYEIAPDLLIPEKGELAELCANCSHDGLEVISTDV